MSSVTECLSQIQKLTKKNLEILQGINESFFTKQNHLYINVDDSQYVIPSFISLENKINSLEENFNNLINVPSTGEAYFQVDGNTRAIELKSYTQVPNSVTLNEVSEFKTYQNDVFKDFLTPIPYVNFNISSIPNDIVSVNVKKIIPKNDELINMFKTLLTKQENNNIINLSSLKYKYSDIYKILAIYEEDKDYIEYDTTRKLPIRKTLGSATYVIETVKSDLVDNNLDNYITLKLRSDLTDSQYTNTLTYKLFDETIEKPLSVGDQLITYDGTGKVEITKLYTNTNSIEIKVLNGDFLNLVGTDQYDSSSSIGDLSKLKFFSPVDFDNDKYVNVPLEEDQYVFISIAPLNDRMNVQSSWGTGVLLNTYELKNSLGETFDKYYTKNVKNLGDVLFEMSSMMNNTITGFNEAEFNRLSSVIPIINTDDISVVQINKHLNNSNTVKNIRALYSQKKRYNTELEEIQTKIDEINNHLASISFDDTTNLRTGYVSQLTEYNNKKNELVTSITKIIDEISKSVNDSEVPIENAKYRIRGFFDYDEFINNSGLTYLKNHINGIKVQYRYKTVNQEQGNAVSMSKGFIFSDWNNMNSFINPKTPKYENGSYKFELSENNNTINEPSFNQIDIPISQGETVDIRLKVIYDFGYPFIETTSNWSEIVNIEFPSEFLKDVEILDIISENNNDIETNRFSNILKGEGVPDHISDKIIDQDITYYHKPDNIASGFYTAERRIVPLKDKLLEMHNLITQIQDEISGSTSDSISISIVNGDIVNTIYPWNTNNVHVQPYDDFIGGTNISISEGTYDYNTSNKVVSTVLNLVITNTSDHTVKLYSMFPGNRDTSLNKLNNYKFDINDYINSSNGVWIRCQSNKSENNEDLIPQTCNQYITFRINNLNTGETYYENGEQWGSAKLSLSKDYIKYGELEGDVPDGATLYPYIKDEKSIHLDNDSTNAYILINPKQEIVIPFVFEYKLANNLQSINKTISFDLRPSLYTDPINYVVKVIAKNKNVLTDKLVTTNRKRLLKNGLGTKYNTTVIK